MRSSGDVQDNGLGETPTAPMSPRARVAGSPRDTIAGFLWLAFAPVCVFAPKASVIFLVLFALVIPDPRAVLRALRDLMLSRFGMLIGGFAVWSIVSSAWSPSPVGAVSASLRFTAILLVGLLVFAAARTTPPGAMKRTVVCMAAAPFLIAAFLGLEILTDGFVRSLLRPSDQFGLVYASRGSATLAILTLASLPLVLLWKRASWGPLALVVVAVMAIVPLPMTTSVVALAGGLAVGAMVWALGPLILRFVAALAIVVSLASPWIFSEVITPAKLGDRFVDVPISLQHRLGIWEFAGSRALERPLFGHGFDSSREIDREERGMVRMVTKDMSWEMERMPLHPHSFALQVWLELGLVGICLFAGVLLALVGAIANSSGNRITMAATAGALTTGLTFMFMSFGAWQSWWVATLWLMAAVCGASIAVASRPSEREGRGGP